MKISFNVLFPAKAEGEFISLEQVKALFMPLTECKPLGLSEEDIARSISSATYEDYFGNPPHVVVEGGYGYKFQCDLMRYAVNDGEWPDGEKELDSMIEAMKACAERVKDLAKLGRFSAEYFPNGYTGKFVQELDVSEAYRLWTGDYSLVQKDKKTVALGLALDSVKTLLGEFGLDADMIEEASASLFKMYTRVASGCR